MRRFPASIMSGTKVVPTSTSASGLWTLPEQIQAVQANAWPLVPSGVVTISQTAASIVAETGSSHTFTATAIGTAAADRFVVVGLMGSQGVTSISSVTIGGNSASSLITVVPFAGSLLALYGLTVTTGTTADIVITFNAATNNSQGIGVWAVYGTNGTTSSTASDIAHDPLTAAITVPTNGGALGYATSGVAGGTFIWTNMTERFDATQSNAYSHSGADTTTAGTPTVSSNPSAGTGWGLVIAAFASA